MNQHRRTITAAVTDVDGSTTIRGLQMEGPRADEVLVRLVATGICHTDIAMRGSSRTPKPVVLGHEGAGIVEAVGTEVTRLRPGDRVVLSIASCGVCKACSLGAPAHCRHEAEMNFRGRRLDGSTALLDGERPIGSHFFGQSSFASHCLAYERSCVPVGDSLPLERLGPLGCGFQAGAGAVLNTLALKRGQTLAVIGTGAVGLAAVMAAAIAGAGRIVAVDINAGRLETAQSLGATDTIDASTTPVIAALLGLLPDGLDAIIDTTGDVPLLHDVIDALGLKGRLAIVSSANGADLSFNALGLMTNGRQVVGVIAGDSDPQTFIPLLIEHHLAGRFPFDRLINFYGFDRLDQAMEDMRSGRVVKPVIRMGG